MKKAVLTKKDLKNVEVDLTPYEMHGNGLNVVLADNQKFEKYLSKLKF